MSGIKQVTQFVTKTQVKKVVLESLTPIMQKIQQEIQRLTQQSHQMFLYNEKSKEIQKRQNLMENSIKDFHNSMSEARQNINVLKDEDKRISLNSTIQIQRMKDQLDSIQRQSNKKEDKIKDYDNKITSMRNQLMKETLKNETQFQKMRNHIQKTYAQTLTLIRGHSQQTKKAKDRMEIVSQSLQRQREKFDKINQSMLLYENERQNFINRIEQIQTKLKDFLQKEDLLNFRKSLQKRIEQKEVQTKKEYIPQPNNYEEEFDRIKQLVKKVEDKVKNLAHILELQVQVQNIKRQIQQDQSSIKSSHSSLQSVLNRIQQRLNALKQKQQQQSIQVKKKTQEKYLDLNKQLQAFKAQFQSKLHQITTQSKNIEENYQQEMQKFKQQLRNKDQIMKKDIVEQITEINQKIMSRCISIEQLGASLQEKLALFSNKLVKMKSDYDLFENAIRKETAYLVQNKHQIDRKLKQVGSILAKFAQMQLISQSINVYKAPFLDNSVYVTVNDGIISEMEKLQNGEYVFFYRKRHLSLDQLNKAVMISLVELVDSIFENNQFLDWKQYRPSNFFVDNIFPHYSILHEKAIKTKNLLKAPQYTTSRMHSRQNTETQQNQITQRTDTKRNSSVSQMKRPESRNQKIMAVSTQQHPSESNNKNTASQLLQSESNTKKNSESLTQRPQSHNKNFSESKIKRSQFSNSLATELPNLQKQQHSTSNNKEKLYQIKRKKLQQHNNSFDSQVFAPRSNRYSNHKLQ